MRKRKTGIVLLIVAFVLLCLKYPISQYFADLLKQAAAVNPFKNETPAISTAAVAAYAYYANLLLEFSAAVCLLSGILHLHNN